MKTAASNTKEEIGKFLVDTAVAGVRQWAKQEAKNIRYDLSYPTILPINKKTFVIGNFKIEILSDHDHLVHKDKKFVHTFYNKKAAVFYCVLTKKNYFNLADKILIRDKTVSMLYDDIQFFQEKLNKNKDSFKHQLWHSRLSELKSKFMLNNQELDKIILTTKYSKIWTNLLHR